MTTPHVRAAEPTSAPSTQPTGPRVLQQRDDRLLVELPNRMIVIVQELHSSPIVSAQVFVKTGSIYEQQHVGAGLSHFLEHLLAGGTTSTRSEEETRQLLGKIGARTNAATSLDTVRYYINTTRPYAATAVDLLSDWMQHNLITPAEYERERQVIQNEFDMGQGEPARIFWKATQQARYLAHPARHPTIGYLNEFLQISRDEIYAFYKRMYVPNNMVFVVVGDVDKQTVVDQIARLWADAPAGELPALKFPVEPLLDHPTHVTARADVRAPRLRLAWSGTKLGEDGDYALDLLANVLGEGESSVLVRTVRDEARAVNTIDAYNYSAHWGKGFFGIDAEINPPEGVSLDAAVETTKGLILAQVQRIADEGITESELARARRQTLTAVLLSAQSAQGLAARLASDIIATGDPDYLRHYADAIEKVSAREVQQAARRFLDSQRLITVTLLPASKDDAIAELSRPADPPGAADFPTEPVKLDNQQLLARLDESLRQARADRSAPAYDPVERFTLSNGLRVLVSRNTLVPGVSIQLYHLGGALADTPGHEGLANAVAEMLTRGTTTRTADAISAAVDDLGAALDTAGGYNSFYVQAVCLSDDLPKMLDLAADVALHPSFPADQWKMVQQRLLAAIDRQNDQWSTELRNRFRQAYYGAHVWSQPTVGRRDAVAALTPQDLAKFHTSHLGASQAVLAIVGDIDPRPRKVQELVEKCFGEMPAKPAVPFNPAQPQAPTAAAAQFPTPKPLAAVQIGFGPGITRNNPDYAPLQVLSRIVSDFPSGRLENALRGEGRGLAYAVGAGNVTGLVPGYFAIIWNTKPQDVPASLEEAAIVIAAVRDEPISDTELQRARAGVLTDEFLGKQTNADRASELGLDALYGLPEDASERFLQQVQSLTPAELDTIAHKYLTNPVITIITHDPVPDEALSQTLTTLNAASK
ncbi:MAG: insulinase family protein [Phycisphaeraceae bacterium]|nr:insulinase family protein [Phycisphaeraceae bacterium]